MENVGQLENIGQLENVGQVENVGKVKNVTTIADMKWQSTCCSCQGVQEGIRKPTCNLTPSKSCCRPMATKHGPLLNPQRECWHWETKKDVICVSPRTLVLHFGSTVFRRVAATEWGRNGNQIRPWESLFFWQPARALKREFMSLQPLGS